MTFLQIINKVLVRLREATVLVSATDEYANLIGEFVNEAKREVEDAWKWNVLRQTITVATVDGTSAYSITGSGKRFKIIDIYETTTDTWITRGNSTRMKAEIEEGSKGQPHHYYIEGVDSSGDMKIHFSLTPDAVYSYNINCIVPQGDLVDATVLTVPEEPVVLGAYFKAISERGEDGGTGAQAAGASYNSSMSNAIQLDVALTQDEDEWYV